MSLKWMLYWVLFALTLAVYLAMILWSLPYVSNQAGGLAPFDLRLGGYSPDAARAFLAALQPDGRQFYLGVQQQLDRAYPAMMAVVLSLGALGIGRGRWRWLAMPAIATALLGAAFDYLENAAVRIMLLAGTDGLTIDMVTTASRWTVLKSAMTSVSMVLVLVMLALLLRHRLRGRRE